MQASVECVKGYIFYVEPQTQTIHPRYEVVFRDVWLEL